MTQEDKETTFVMGGVFLTCMLFFVILVACETNNAAEIVKKYEEKIRVAEPGDQVVLYSNQRVILEKYLNKGWKIVLKDRGSTVIEKENQFGED